MLMYVRKDNSKNEKKFLIKHEIQLLHTATQTKFNFKPFFYLAHLLAARDMIK